MQQNIIVGNMFQRYMGAKFNIDVSSTSVAMSNVRGKENLVYEYINNLSSCFQTQPMNYDVNGNPNGLYANYTLFKKNFVKYWRRALDIAMIDTQQLEDIFDDEVISQEECRNLNTAFVFFENGNALTVEACLDAIYDVLELG